MTTYYDVLYYSYQFKSKPGEVWSEQKIEDEFCKQGSYDFDYSETFEDRDEAMKSVGEYLDNKMLAPYIEKTNIGYVVSGEIIEVVERVGEDYIAGSCTYTKGMSK